MTRRTRDLKLIAEPSALSGIRWKAKARWRADDPSYGVGRRRQVPGVILQLTVRRIGSGNIEAIALLSFSRPTPKLRCFSVG